MRHGSKKYRLIQKELDDAGIITNIIKAGPKWYELYVNYERAKAAKKRDTCNKHLIKLFNQINQIDYGFKSGDERYNG